MIFKSMGFFVPVFNQQSFCSVFKFVSFTVVLCFVNWLFQFPCFTFKINQLIHFQSSHLIDFIFALKPIQSSNLLSFQLVFHCSIHCTLLKAFHIHCTLLYWFPGNPSNSTLLQSCVTLFTRIKLCKWTGVTFHIDKRQYRRQLSPSRLPTSSRHGTEWIFLHWRMFYF